MEGKGGEQAAAVKEEKEDNYFIYCVQSSPSLFQDKLPRYKPSDKAMATRKFSEVALNAMAPVLPELVGGSADLTPSTLTELKVGATTRLH